MPIFVTVMLALCNACWDLVLSRAAMLIKHVLCLVLPTDTTGSAHIGPYWENLATFRKAFTVSITTCNSLQSTSVAREQSFIFNNYANANIHLPINPIGLIIKGFYF